MKPDSMDRAAELLRLGFDIDEIEALMGSWTDSSLEIRNELLDLQNSLEEIQESRTTSQPVNRFVDYKTGWYQDLDGNLYKYDGIIWDVVPGRETGELEFLG